MNRDQKPQSKDDAAQEAAQNVVDDVASWEYSAEKDRIADELDTGLDEAGVDVEPAERERLVEEIDAMKHDEGSGAPQVNSADPAADQEGSASQSSDGAEISSP